ncbi:bifunctional glutamate N-acetyltransferase/amino-acid acetyltransferase ArgJ [Pelagicoccus sp. SDUM812003]|uniref:bifunctional glutamate N-acetyltransferase/amino-acid acetyltransferase ArgJ n=1 Tax=Pelagicoccus sp. SDUM812003 TaxID=3041267 RepID=UPI00280D08E5|nr:bifunctional glutamate N-acetyltransferase/amino-acid acetyltransferase ArgJ [Pelagicoccus sp. SDUM812003]MDQ8204195.1 bifunctional glutamate N-acetyltransferase/amino-acid acetyltransferase ArgJ [Pelagicoccus sp. SDUM812003]
MPTEITFTQNTAGVTDPKGFFAKGVSADIRRKGNDRLDTGIVFSRKPCSAAGVFTKNRVKAAPVLECVRTLDSGAPIHGIVANSGNANACTGEQGKKDAEAMARQAAAACGVSAGSFLVCSTGRIGELLPMDKISGAIAKAGAAAAAGEPDGESFSNCILTSDTRKKTCTASFEVDGKKVTLAGSAKGAGMIQPNMATMLAFVTTDIAADSATLKSLLSEVVKRTFNAITVDGDMSTNDTVLVLANGESGVSLDGACLESFKEALFRICDALADKIVADGERITKVVELLISGADSEQGAENIARAIGNSLLVKTSWFGNDPNWGRLMDALGYADSEFDPDGIDIHYGDVPALVSSTPIPENKPKWKEIVSQKRFTIRIDLHAGDASYRLRATDLTEGYVDFNKSE